MLSVQSPLVPETLKLMIRTSTGSKAVTPLLRRGEPCGLAIEIEVEIVCEEVVGACDAARLPVSEMVVSQSDALV